MAKIIAPRALHVQTDEGCRFELEVPGTSERVLVLIDERFGEDVPEEAHVSRPQGGDGPIVLSPVDHTEDCVLVIDRFDPVSEMGVRLDMSSVAFGLRLVDPMNRNDKVVFVGSGGPETGLGFAMLLAEGDQLHTLPVDEGGRMYVAWVDKEGYHNELMTYQEFLDRFG